MEKISEKASVKDEKLVISICGGSGVGKTGIAGILSYYLKENGVNSYVLSGDNYPQRIPIYNDAERLSVMRKFALRELVKSGEYTKERFDIIYDLQKNNEDSNPIHKEKYHWFEHYYNGAKKGLESYLGTNNEQCYDEFNEVLAQFKNNENKFLLRRLGRNDTDLWYDEVDFSDVEVLIIEWTHGNSEFINGVAVGVLLNSTPLETKEHRRARNRETDEIDSPFIELVLSIEQNLLTKNAHKSDIIMSKSGEFLSYEQFKKVMNIKEV